jgi:hypothetical protein
MNQVTGIFLGSLGATVVLVPLLMSSWVRERPVAVSLLFILLLGAMGGLFMAFLMFLAIGYVP